MVVLDSRDVSQWQCSVLGRNFARCWPAIINNNSNLYSHYNNNECIGKAQNKLHWRRMFSVSAQAQTCLKPCLRPTSMTVGIEYQTLKGVAA